MSNEEGVALAVLIPMALVAVALLAAIIRVEIRNRTRFRQEDTESDDEVYPATKACHRNLVCNRSCEASGECEE